VEHFVPRALSFWSVIVVEELIVFAIESCVTAHAREENLDLGHALTRNDVAAEFRRFTCRILLL